MRNEPQQQVFIPKNMLGFASSPQPTLLASIPERYRKTLTADNGSEFARFKQLEEQLGFRVYFANPYSAWERGANENTNGLLRQYFPKGCNFNAITDQ